MPCADIERLVLLAQSGEISPRRRRKLEEHLAACGGCRDYGAEVERLCGVALPAARTPGGAALARIRAAAEAAAAKPRWLIYRPPVFQALAWAAALALLLGGWFAFLPDRRAARIGEVCAILNAVSESPLPASQTGEGTLPDEQLRALAKELLILEGLSVEAVDAEASSAVTPPSEPDPTVLQLRSTDGLPAKRCV